MDCYGEIAWNIATKAVTTSKYCVFFSKELNSLPSKPCCYVDFEKKRYSLYLPLQWPSLLAFFTLHSLASLADLLDVANTS